MKQHAILSGLKNNVYCSNTYTSYFITGHVKYDCGSVVKKFAEVTRKQRFQSNHDTNNKIQTTASPIQECFNRES